MRLKTSNTDRLVKVLRKLAVQETHIERIVQTLTDECPSFERRQHLVILSGSAIDHDSVAIVQCGKWSLHLCDHSSNRTERYQHLISCQIVEWVQRYIQYGYNETIDFTLTSEEQIIKGIIE